MQSENLCTNEIEGLNAESLIPVEFLLYDDSQRSRSQDALSIVELGKQLLLSAKNGDTEAVRDLMCRGAPFTTDWLGTSALHFAAQNNHTSTAEVLLRAGISRDARTKVDRTPLHMAAYEGHYAMADILLKFGADVDSRDMLKMTPLHWAVERGQEEVMHLLLEYGADPNAVSKFDKTPISLALEHDRLDFVDILQQEREMVQIRAAQQQNQASTAEIEEATHSLMQMQEAERQQEQAQLEIQQQQQMQKRKLQQQGQGQSPKKTKIMFQPMQLSSTSDDEREKEAELVDRINSIENSTIKKRKELGSFKDLEQPLRFLEAHGITMIPVDNDAGIVENAMESGGTVVLTEAGKLALNLTRSQQIGIKRLQEVQVGGSTYRARGRKVIAIRADQLINQTQPIIQKGPNILKRNTSENKSGKILIASLGNNANSVTLTKPNQSPIKIQIRTPELIQQQQPQQQQQQQQQESPVKSQNPILLKLDDEIEEITEETETFEIDTEPLTDIALLNKQLIEARRLAAEYRKQLQKKEEEAEIYKQQLKNITAQRTTK